MGKDWSWKPDNRTRKAIYRGNKIVARKKSETPSIPQSSKPPYANA
jgi:hypothetical protein